MQMRLRGRSFLAFGLLVASWFLVLQLKPQTVNTRKSAGPSARYGEYGAISMPDDRAEDSYAIYAELMPGESFASLPPQQSARWAIAEITVNERDRNPAVSPLGQLKPPPDNMRGFDEAVSDYESNKNVRVKLQKNDLRLSHAFSLLPPEEVAAFRASKTSGQVSSETQSQWAGYPGVTFFSEVYFDEKHEAALVYQSEWCANLCASGTWIYLEKHGGQWVRRSGVVVPGA